MEIDKAEERDPKETHESERPPPPINRLEVETAPDIDELGFSHIGVIVISVRH